MKKPKISVVIPTLEEEKYLRISLDSFKKQDFKDFEIIIADGGSKDRTVKIAKRYTAETYVFPGANVCLARDLGTRKARGGIIVGADADTFYPENYLQEINGIFDKHPEIVALTGKIYFRNCPWWWIWVWWLLYTSYDLVYDLTGLVVYAPALNLSFRKSAFYRVNGYNTQLDFGGDELDFLGRLKKVGRIHYIKSPMPLPHSRRLKMGFFRFFFVQFIYNYWLNYLLAKLFGRAIIRSKPVR